MSLTRYNVHCATEFVETPSLMLENWVYVPEVLTSLGRHYSYISPEYNDFWLKKGRGKEGIEQPAEAMPEQLAMDIEKMEDGSGAGGMLFQVMIAIFDLTIHNTDTLEATKAIDTTALWNAIENEILNNDIHMLCGFYQVSVPHFFKGYSATYFTYPM